MRQQGLLPVVLGVVLILGGAVVAGTMGQSWPDAAKLQSMTARYAPVDIGADILAAAAR